MSGSQGPRGRSEVETRLLWLRCDSEGHWRKVVVDVKITTTDKMNEAFKEKDEKCRV